MKILHAIRSVNPVGGGPIEGVKQLTVVNTSEGHRVEILALDSPSDNWVSSTVAPVHAVGPAWSKYGYSPRLVPWLRAHATEYDVIIVNGIWQYNAFGVWRALRASSVPYFVFTHGMLDPWFKRTYPLKHFKKWLYWPWADYRVLRDATAVLFTCEEERRLARASFWLYRANERVVNYGTAGPTGDSAQQKDAFLEKYPKLRGKRCLLFLGRVHVKKGPDLLLKALARILRGWPEQTRDVQLVMAGPNDHAFGREMAALAGELGLADRVTWTGMITGDLKWGTFYAADAFILPSHQENFGIAVAESLACGTPVLITKPVNIWREIAEDGAGIVDEDTVDGTERMIRAWLDEPREKWAERKLRARRCYENRFTIGKSAESLLRVIREFVPKKT